VNALHGTCAKKQVTFIRIKLIRKLSKSLFCNPIKYSWQTSKIR